MKELIFTMITMLSPQYDIDPRLANSIVQIESQYNPKARGKLGELGLFQIRPEFSKHSAKELMDIEINIREGLTKLKEAQTRCSHKLDLTWVICYNYGITNARKVRFPKSFPYYKKLMVAMREQ